MTVLTWIGVFVLGGLAALARFTLDAIVSTRFGRSFPLGTLGINLSGAAALGLITGLTLTGNALILIGTATIGSYTTFSTWVLEIHRQREAGEFLRALNYSTISLLLGLAAVAIGRTIGAHL